MEIVGKHGILARTHKVSFLITALASQSTLLTHLFHREIPLEREIIFAALR